jgi:hypothetical protein
MIETIQTVSAGRALREDFRFPNDFGTFSVPNDLSPEPGFFRFGSSTVYGRCSMKPLPSPKNLQVDALDRIRSNDATVELPFDPDEVIDNLRMERYAANAAGTTKNFLYHAYYAARPLMPVWFRRHLQKTRLQKSRKLPFPQWPLDCTVENLQEQLVHLALRAEDRESVPFTWFWPRSFPACAIITHDVETNEGVEFCPTLMDINDSFGIKSSFQLVPEKRYAFTDQVLHRIKDRGFEINVHDLNHDGHLYSDREEFLRRAAKINQYARAFGANGFRAGAMYRNLDWYDAFEFSYDMSVPTVGHLEAQGGGCCTVRPYFIGNILQLPLTTTQDYSLFHILGEYSIDLWKRQVDAIIAKNGLISFIVHPDYIIEKKARQTYTSLLAYLAQLRTEGKLWIARPGEVAQWWRERSQMRLVEHAGLWNVAGSGSERSRVAYAFASESGVTYQLSDQIRDAALPNSVPNVTVEVCR